MSDINKTLKKAKYKTNTALHYAVDLEIKHCHHNQGGSRINTLCFAL
jgi:hypothetical protein